MGIEVLVSTMHQVEKDYSLLERMNINSDAVVINQCNSNSMETLTFRNWSIKWVNTTERGLSNSRNMAISYSTAEYCLVADDDEVFINDYAQIVIGAFERHPKKSILRFQVHGIEKVFKNYRDREFRISWLNSMKMSSVELAIRRCDIINNDISFDYLIGAGTEFMMGEENAFAWTCLKKGLLIYNIPQCIADLHIGESTWFSGFNDKYFFGRGAAFAAMSKAFSIPLIIQFAIRRRKNAEISMKSSIINMLKGRKEYLNRKNKCNSK